MKLEQVNENIMQAVEANNRKIAELKQQIKSLENTNLELMQNLMYFIKEVK